MGVKKTQEQKENMSRIAKERGYGKWMAGKTLSKVTKEKMRLAHKGEKNYLWKGDDAGYRVKHGWVSRWYGKPSLCDHCGTNEKRPYQWANKSGEYKRERSDWLRLCVPCHSIFDNQAAKAWATRRLKASIVDWT